MDSDTRAYKRRLDDRPARIWSKRALWFVLGILATLAYVVVMRFVMGPI